MWQRVLAPFIEAGDIEALGIVQEQHPDRARLYRQWKQLDWPVYVDSLDLLDHSAVPVPYLLDEAGVVRATRLRPDEEAFGLLLESLAEPPRLSATFNRAAPLLAEPDRVGTVGAPSASGERLFLSAQATGSADRRSALLTAAIDALETAVRTDRTDARARFRLGVALRARSDGSGRRPGDAQEAVERWGEALAMQPNQYIWRRRIQQYGPRLDKPYDFYSWVREARRDIVARGETPVALTAEPRGSEIATPLRAPDADSALEVPDPDPDGRIQRAAPSLVDLDPLVTPARVRPGDRIRARLSLRVDPPGSKWNNEADPLTVHLALPDGVALEEGALVHPQPESRESDEERIVEAELRIDPERAPGPLEIEGYALFTICEESGVCRLLRRDFVLRCAVDPEAVRIQ